MRRRALAWAAMLFVVLVAGCARPRTGPEVPAPPRVGYEERGEASWYGAQHQGRRTASGESFQMQQMTAAHRTFPFGTWLLVENLANGRVAQVRVNDRGPFVDGRILDLSWAAARSLGAMGAGVIPVRVRVVEPPRSGADDRASFTVQIGAFIDKDRALALVHRAENEGAPARIESATIGERTVYRVRVGRFASRATALEQARRLAKRGHAAIVAEE